MAREHTCPGTQTFRGRNQPQRGLIVEVCMYEASIRALRMESSAKTLAGETTLSSTSGVPRSELLNPQRLVRSPLSAFHSRYRASTILNCTCMQTFNGRSRGLHLARLQPPTTTATNHLWVRRGCNISRKEDGGGGAGGGNGGGRRADGGRGANTAAINISAV